MRIRDWSSDVCSSDLYRPQGEDHLRERFADRADDREAAALLLRPGRQAHRDLRHRAHARRRQPERQDDAGVGDRREVGEARMMPLWLDMLRTPMAAPETIRLRVMRRAWLSPCVADRKSVELGKIVAVRVYPGGRLILKKKTLAH